jgi:hypothetical protein
MHVRVSLHGIRGVSDAEVAGLDQCLNQAAA